LKWEKANEMYQNIENFIKKSKFLKKLPHTKNKFETSERKILNCSKSVYHTTATKKENSLKLIKRKFIKNRDAIQRKKASKHQKIRQRDLIKVYSPFLSKGYYVCGSNPAMYYEVAQPASYNNLFCIGALEKFDFFINESTNKLSDRQVWKYPETAFERHNLKYRFNFFKKKAKEWVSIGILNP